MRSSSALTLALALCVAVSVAVATRPTSQPGNGTLYSAVLSGDSWSVVEGQAADAYAFGSYVDTVNVTGWGNLVISTNPTFNDSLTMFAAGYLEAFLTHGLIWHNWVNLMQGGDNVLPPQIYRFLEENYEWTMESIEAGAAPQQFWQHVALIMRQFSGLVEGYRAFAPHRHALDRIELLSLSANGDIDSLTLKFNISLPNLSTAAGSHCSALVKVLPDFSDVYFGHSTWAAFNSMLRTWKTYNFALNAPGTAARTIGFSSYPGFLTSTDDWFTMDTGLVVTETTNGNFNASLWDNVTPATGVLSWARTLAACRMSASGQEWVENFVTANSKTYNNQWIVLDLPLFVPGQSLDPNLLWIVEQYPGAGDGYIAAAVTDILAAGYWPSYNVPYFEEINTECEFPQQVAQYGNYLFSYELCARAMIFRRNQTDVASLQDFMALMRYNNWQSDPFSSGNAGLAISSRFDLVTQAYPNNPSLARAPFGALDSKVTAHSMWVANGASSMAQSGPTKDQQPPFAWAAWPEVYHEKMPAVFDFPWVLMTQQE